jgi:pimeloyl-ACP methyl ester carboxylesterase
MSHVRVKLEHPSFDDLVDKNSFAFLTEEEARRAVVFVHGYGGNPSGTWSQMPQCIENDKGWKNTDAYFIGYNSRGDEVMKIAEQIAAFILAICPVPPTDLFRVAALKSAAKPFWLRSGTTKYSEIYLVGHSLGGVVVRAAIVDMLRNGLARSGSNDISKLTEARSLACHAKLRLFAPAVGGARLAGLIGFFASLPILSAIVKAYRGWSPSFTELGPENQLLNTLRNQTEGYTNQYPELAALRASIAWADDDDIVQGMSYMYDATTRIRNTNHTTVCKPSTRFRAPFTFVNNGFLTQEEGAVT